MLATRAAGLGLAIILAGAAPALAQPRVSTTAVPCGQAQAIVGSQGAVVLGTGGATYDRFVASQAFCEREETTRPAFVPTLDNPQCPIGYRCVSADRRPGRF
jgi:hypothetical protein